MRHFILLFPMKSVVFIFVLIHVLKTNDKKMKTFYINVIFCRKICLSWYFIYEKMKLIMKFYLRHYKSSILQFTRQSVTNVKKLDVIYYYHENAWQSLKIL